MVGRLKELRQKYGVSQQTLGEAIGVSQQSVNKYENHGVEPDIQVLIAIADYFQTSVDYLIGHSDVDHKIEVLHPYDLNEEEKRLIHEWRKLNAKEKASIFSILENYGSI